MPGNNKPLTRDQLASFLPNHEAVKAFEKLFQDVNSLPSEEIIILIQETALVAQSSDARAQQALDTLQRLADLIELLVCAPIVQIGTLGEQQADKVSITNGVVSAELKNNQVILLESIKNLDDFSDVNLATLTNSPVAGDPTKWVSINDNGIIRAMPTWELP